MQPLSFVEKTISPINNAEIEIIDPVEGNIHLELQMATDTNVAENTISYDVIDSHHAKLSIINVQQDKFMSVPEPIIIGTYGGKYKLTANIRLTPVEQDGSRKVRIVFFISEKGE